jgi:hypothetical protein
MLILHRLKSPSSLLQVDDWLDLIVSWPKDLVVDPQARVLKAQTPFHLLPELGKHLPYITHLEGLNGQAPKHGLSS